MPSAALSFSGPRTFEGPGLQKHHHNSTRRPQREKSGNGWLEKAKKRDPSGPHPFGRWSGVWREGTNLVLALQRSSTSVSSAGLFTTQFERRSPCVIHLFYFFRVEIHLSLLCSFNSITTRWVCLTRCFNSDATIL